MKKSLLTIAVIAALPFAAHATDPVVAVGPAHASSNPVVATANAPYVTVTPSQADESHIATTAYVKGAYNSAIAAVNNVANTVDGKQAQLLTTQGAEISPAVFDINSGDAHLSSIASYAGTLDTTNANRYWEGIDSMGPTIPTTATVGAAFIDGLTSLGNFVLEQTANDFESGLADKQDKLVDWLNNNKQMSDKVLGNPDGNMASALLSFDDASYAAFRAGRGIELGAQDNNPDYALISAGAVFQLIRDTGQFIQNNKRVEIYTTWDDDTAKQQVAFVNAQ